MERNTHITLSPIKNDDSIIINIYDFVKVYKYEYKGNKGTITIVSDNLETKDLSIVSNCLKDFYKDVGSR